MPFELFSTSVDVGIPVHGVREKHRRMKRDGNEPRKSNPEVYLPIRIFMILVYLSELSGQASHGEIGVMAINAPYLEKITQLCYNALWRQ